MDRRFVLHRFARARAAFRRALPASFEAQVLGVWNRLQGGYRRRRADVVLVSYPKAGRTWLHWMLGHALQSSFAIDGEPTTDVESLHDADQRIPRIFSTHDGVMPRMRAQEIRRDKRRYAKQDVILLVRDPRDVVVSDYHHLRDRMGIATGSIDELVLGPESGIDTVLAFHGAWRDALHVPKRTLVVRYEDLRARPREELARVLAFLGAGSDARTIDAAVNATSFDAMQKLERSGTHETAALRPVDVTNAASFKVRRGAVGGYRDEVSSSTRAVLDAKVADANLTCFGYR